jgi:DMSO reductase anchor subunit
MHPAYSVIIFTTTSGAGYGLMFWLALAVLAGLLPHDAPIVFWGWAAALALVSAGLLSSTLHLGRPERAWRAVSQWRSSWLSREGVAALATYVPAGLLALLSLLGAGAGLAPALALLSALGAVATVWCTGMIYAALRTVRQWNMRLVPVNYLFIAAATGALLLGLALALAGWATQGPALLALAALVAAGALKLAYWRRIDGDAGRYTSGAALGIGAETVRQIDPPHSRPNYVMREMGYHVARRHAARLRGLVRVALFALPGLAMLLHAATGAAALPAFALATLSAAVGLFCERWLFFAEAQHVSSLYYGAQRA